MLMQTKPLLVAITCFLFSIVSTAQTGKQPFADLGKKVKMIPSVLLRYVPKYAPLSADFNATFIFIERIWLGAAYRLNDSYNFLLAVNITKAMRVGYTYDLTVSPLNKYTTGTHEIMVSFDSDFKRLRYEKPEPVTYF